MWFRSRKHIVRTLVCGLVLASLATVLIVAPGKTEYELTGEYLRRARFAFAKEEWEAADLYFRRCLQIDPRNDAARFGFALCADRRGDEARDVSLMSAIAGRGAAGEPRAHLWLAEKLLSAQPTPAKETLRAAQGHLELAVRGLPNELRARELLAGVYLRSELPEEAIEQFRIIARSSPQGSLTLAALLRDHNQPVLAQEAALNAARGFSRQLDDDPDNVQLRTDLATAYTMANLEQAAEQVLREGLAIEPHDSLRIALANLFVLGYRNLAARENASFTAKLELPAAALDLDPQHTAAMACLAELTAGDGQESGQARRQLVQALAKGKAPALVHLILGTIAQDRGDLERAEMHLQRATELNPSMPAVANNLARVLMRSDQTNAGRALKLVDHAIALVPQHPEFRATRGVILLVQGKLGEAVTELERALQQLPERPDLHVALATAYEGLGEPELAAEHRKFGQQPTGAEAQN
jgi:Tfp pilus assembly protein PilF